MRHCPVHVHGLGCSGAGQACDERPPVQDLFFKYSWNNFLHFQVELCVAAILSRTAPENRAEAAGPDGNGVAEPPETPQPAAGHLEEHTMVTHVSPPPQFFSSHGVGAAQSGTS